MGKQKETDKEFIDFILTILLNSSKSNLVVSPTLNLKLSIEITGVISTAVPVKKLLHNF